jgi:hypothetical protein
MTYHVPHYEFYLRVVRDGGTHFGYAVGIDLEDAIRAYNATRKLNVHRKYSPGAVTVLEKVALPYEPIVKKTRKKKEDAHHEYACSLF